MFQKGSFIARIPNDGNAAAKIAEFKSNTANCGYAADTKIAKVRCLHMA